MRNHLVEKDVESPHPEVIFAHGKVPVKEPFPKCNNFPEELPSAKFQVHSPARYVPDFNQVFNKLP
jgi:hypothetical protein